jgi:outer membrane receptor for ferrienterochelin and colicins
MKLSIHSYLIALLGASGAVHGQALDYAALEQLFGEPVTTSVTGSPQRVSEVPASMEIITAEAIRRSGARDIVGVLRHVAGVDVRQTTNDHADVSIRGYNAAFSPRLLVLIDGRQVYADYYGFTPWATLPIELNAIRQIEVVRGPNSALFGFNAVGGVINIVTYDPLTDDVDTVATSVGTQSLAEASAVSTLRTGENSAVRLTVGRRTNDDFATPQRPFEVGTRRGDERTAINIEAAFALSDNVRLDLEGTDSDVGHAEFAPTYSMSYARYDTESLKGTLVADTSRGLVQANLYRNSIVGRIHLGAEAAEYLHFNSEVTVAQLQDVFKVGTDHTVRVSAEYRESAMATTQFTGGEVSYDVFAAGVMWAWQLDPSLTWTSALRHDRLTLSRTGAVPPGYGLTNADWDRSLTEPSFNTGVVWNATDVDTLRATVSRGTQLPSIMNLGGFVLPLPFGYASGVPWLEPTVVKNFETGWARSLAAVGGTLDLALFHGHTSEIVSILGGSRFDLGLFGTPTNVGRSETSGLTLSVDASFGDGWRWGAGYTAQQIRDSLAPDALAVALTDHERTTPRHVLDGRLGWSRGPWEVDGYLRYQSRTRGVAISDPFSFGGYLAPVPSYVSIDARLGYELNDRMTIAISGQNLTESTQRQTSAADVERRMLGTFTYRF